MTKLSSLIADDVEIVGDLNFSNGIRIDGRVRGNVVARPGDGTTRTLLVLSDKGHIEGTIRCGDAVINGTVVGDLDVEHFLELQSNSRIIGTVRYQHLQMDVGAAVRASWCRRWPPHRWATWSSCRWKSPAVEGFRTALAAAHRARGERPSRARRIIAAGRRGRQTA